MAPTCFHTVKIQAKRFHLNSTTTLYLKNLGFYVKKHCVYTYNDNINLTLQNWNFPSQNGNIEKNFFFPKIIFWAFFWYSCLVCIGLSFYRVTNMSLKCKKNKKIHSLCIPRKYTAGVQNGVPRVNFSAKSQISGVHFLLLITSGSYVLSDGKSMGKSLSFKFYR